MKTLAHSRWSIQREDAPIPIHRLAGGSLKIFGFVVPAATVAKIDAHAEEPEPGFAVMYTASCLAAQGLDTEQIEAVLRHIFGRNAKVSQREIASAAWGFSAKRWEPRGAATPRRRTKRATQPRHRVAPGPFDLDVQQLSREVARLFGPRR